MWFDINKIYKFRMLINMPILINILKFYEHLSFIVVFLFGFLIFIVQFPMRFFKGNVKLIRLIWLNVKLEWPIWLIVNQNDHWIWLIWLSFGHLDCHNLSLGLATKAKACKSVGQEWSSGVTFHAPGSVRECEGMNPHTSKWALILGVGVSMDSWIFREWL